jgi:hypothetical protein
MSCRILIDLIHRICKNGHRKYFDNFFDDAAHVMVSHVQALLPLLINKTAKIS